MASNCHYKIELKFSSLVNEGRWVSDDVDDVVTIYTRCKRFQWNTGQTEIARRSTNRRQHQLPTTVIWFGGDFLMPSMFNRDLCVFQHEDAR